MVQLILSLFGFYGVISNDTTWTDTAYLTGDVLVEPCVTLTIAPGTVVLYADTCEWDTAWIVDGEKFPPGYGILIDLIVRGKLRAIGTSNDSIYFQASEESIEVGSIDIIEGAALFEYCSLLDKARWNYRSRMYIRKSEISISNSRFEKWNGISGIESLVKLKNDIFKNSLNDAFELKRGFFSADNCLFESGRELYRQISEYSYYLGTELFGEDLDSCFLKNSSFNSISGYSPQYSRGWNCAAVGLINCQKVEVISCSFDSVYGGCGGYPGIGTDAPGLHGGDGYALFLQSCDSVLIMNNSFSEIHGGSGGPGSNGFHGEPGSSIIILLKDTSPLIYGNEFNVLCGSDIKIDSLSSPIIGGAPGFGNEFLGYGASRAYSHIIHNNSPYDIDATWNFWECETSLIDSLIYDHYDDSTKGIVHYDHATGIEEEEAAPSPETFTIVSTVVHDVLSISLPQRGGGCSVVELFDAAGRRVKTTNTYSREVSLDISDLSRGVYFVSVNPENRHTIRKVIVP